MSTEKEALWARGKEIVLAAPQQFIDVDIETDGIAGHGSMLSVGAITPTGETYYSEIKPAFEDYIEEQRVFSEAHGLERARLLGEAREFPEVMGEFNDWLLELRAKYNKKLVFTALNAGFDSSFVQMYFVKTGLAYPFAKAPLDIKSLALPLAARWDWELTHKDTLPAEITPDTEFEHHALKDAIYQQKLHFGMVALLGKTHYPQATNRTAELS